MKHKIFATSQNCIMRARDRSISVLISRYQLVFASSSSKNDSDMRQSKCNFRLDCRRYQRAIYRNDFQILLVDFAHARKKLRTMIFRGLPRSRRMTSMKDQPSKVLILQIKIPSIIVFPSQKIRFFVRCWKTCSATYPSPTATRRVPWSGLIKNTTAKIKKIA